tara:strand:+ start:907 stop:1053 length:147 start_codon:yes stop_codon:yes gene_type:complete
MKRKFFILKDAIKWWTKKNDDKPYYGIGHFNSDLYFKILIIREEYEEV